MNTFKRKALTSAVLAGLGVAAGNANAVYQDPNGTGNVLIYPYYTVNSADGNAFNTYLTVVNSTDLTKMVRIRFREGRYSTEVRDFSIYLSPNDVWAGAILPNAAGGGAIVTSDNSCTEPVLPSWPTAGVAGAPLRGFDFTNLLFGDSSASEFRAGIGTGLDRTREGYFEIIEQGVIDPTSTNGSLTVHDPATDTPPCGAPLNAPAGGTPPICTEVTSPSGGLHGTATLIHVATGQALGYNAVALASFNEFSAGLSGGTANFCTNGGDPVPQLSDADPFSVVVGNSGLTSPGNLPLRAYRADWLTGVDAVTSTMMHASVMNEFVLENATRSNTDWVVTMPTKRFYVPVDGSAPTAPFTAKFLATVGACETVGFTFFNREERTQPPGQGCPSPIPPGGCGNVPAGPLCWESTVVSMRNGASHTPATDATTSGVLGSANVRGFTITNGIQAGWGTLTFTGANAVAGLVSEATSNSVGIFQDGSAPVVLTGAQTFTGLPVVGFAVWNRQNTAVNCGTVGCKFGELHNHKYINISAP